MEHPLRAEVPAAMRDAGSSRWGGPVARRRCQGAAAVMVLRQSRLRWRTWSTHSAVSV